MQAIDFGPEYNIDSAVTQNYSIDGFDDDDVFARSFNKITGGSVEEFVRFLESGKKKFKELNNK